MGALISSLKGGSVDMPDAQVDLLAKTPNDKESTIFNEFAAQLKEAPKILNLLKDYKGCNEEIREAISKPSDESNLKVWKALQPSILSSTKMYKYSIVIGDLCLKAFEHISTEPTGVQGLESNPGLAALLIKTFSFVIDFDEIKTHNSDLQNDFSYYRRSISKFKMMDKGSETVEAIITDEEANYMSLFFAQHTPMFKSIAQMLNDQIKKKSDLGPSISKYLAALAGSCYHSITKQRATDQEDKDNLFRALVGCTILYDSVHPEGVFIKGSPIDVKQVVKTVNTASSSLSEPLMNGLRFNFVHLNDKTTPKQIKSMLGAN